MSGHLQFVFLQSFIYLTFVLNYEHVIGYCLLQKTLGCLYFPLKLIENKPVKLPTQLLHVRLHLTKPYRQTLLCSWRAVHSDVVLIFSNVVIWHLQRQQENWIVIKLKATYSRHYVEMPLTLYLAIHWPRI